MTPHMEVTVLEIAGIRPALLGLGLSYGKIDHLSGVGKMVPVAMKLIGKGDGHDKFMESIQLWLDVTAPRYWWQEADTYRMSTKQSASTMHTDNHLKLENYEIETDDEAKVLKHLIMYMRRKQNKWQAKKLVLEGLLQRRIWCMSLKTYANIRRQRIKHKLPHWKMFIDEVDHVLFGDNDLSNIWQAYTEKHS